MPIAVYTIRGVLFMKHNKLVRDRVPEIIVQSGSQPITHIASDREYGEKLKEKLF
jgi:predicted house-cleaning noncanonical NTP pyrophosphatase (MazG superfamily)